MNDRLIKEAPVIKNREYFSMINNVSEKAREAFERPAYYVNCNQQCVLCKKVTG